jgi:hypothetical protein
LKSISHKNGNSFFNLFTHKSGNFEVQSIFIQNSNLLFILFTPKKCCVFSYTRDGKSVTFCFHYIQSFTIYCWPFLIKWNSIFNRVIINCSKFVCSKNLLDTILLLLDSIRAIIIFLVNCSNPVNLWELTWFEQFHF